MGALSRLLLQSPWLFDSCAPDFTGCPGNCTNLVFDGEGNNAGFHCGCDFPNTTDPGGELEFCESGQCNNNGCNQCQIGYFQRDHGSPCVSCSDVFGSGCMTCQNNVGCVECNSGYDPITVRIPECSYNAESFTYCRPQICTRPPTTSPTPSPTPAPTPGPTHSPTPSPTHSPTPSPTPLPTSEPTIRPTQPPVASISRSTLGYYYGITDDTQEWTYNEAETYCITQFNTNLASFHDIEHEEDLFKLTSNMINEYNLNIWIGLNDLVKEAGSDGSIGAGWEWTDGTSYDYPMRWAPNMPNKKGDCVDIRKTDNLGNDRYCDNGETRQSFVCNSGLEHVAILSENENYVGVCTDNVNDKWIFDDAELYCNNNFDTNLASIHSLDDENEIISLAGRLVSLYDRNIWIGLNDINNETGSNSNIGSGWEYTDGTSYDYIVSWDTNEPNGDGDCCIIQKSEMEIQDKPCDVSKYCFICNY